MTATPAPHDRLAELIEAVTSSIRDIIKVHHVTEEEWYATLGFLTEVGQADEFILLSDTMRMSVLVDELSHSDTGGTTPSDVLGPFWRPAPLVDNPATLIPEDEPGERLILSGQVRTADGEPIDGAEVDFWQCNAEGLYDVQLPGAEPRYRGRLRAGGDGRYELRTIVPPPYEVKKDGPVGRLLEGLGRHAWRPAHIHCKAEAPGRRPLTTMVFFEGDPWLGNDTIGADKPSLTLTLDRSGGSPARATFDIVLAAAAPG
ncbi:MAG: dioxygenase [Acidimicrobiia bacterium]